MADAANPPLRPVIASAARPAVLVTVALSAVAFVAMAVWLHDGLEPVGVDRSLDTWLRSHTGSTIAALLLATSEPVLTLGVAAVAALGALVARRVDIAVFAAVSPPLTAFLGSVVLKPVIGRKFGFAQDAGLTPGWAFPSGHQGTLTASVLVLVVLVSRAPWPRPAQVASYVVAVLWIGLGVLGLVRNRYHYVTDTIGAILLALVVVPLCALAVDAARTRFGRPLSSPAGRDRTRTPPAA